MKTRFDNEPTKTHGEITSIEWKIKWIEGGRNIDDGECVIPMMLDSEAAKDFAASFALLEDLVFTKDVFIEAEKNGPPDHRNTTAKALIFSGVIAYGRCFGGGVREVRLSADDLSTNVQGFNNDIHRYLIDVRDKHVAHSVNAFEVYVPVGILIGKHEEELRDGFGVGVITNRSIGLSRRIILEAIDHIHAIEKILLLRIDKEKNNIHAEFASELKKGKQFEIAPLLKALDRSKVGRRR